MERAKTARRAGRATKGKSGKAGSGPGGKPPGWKPYAALALGLLLLDQGSKALTRGLLTLGESVAVIPGALWLTHVRNTGASFGMLRGNNALLLWVAVIVLGILIYSYESFRTRTERACYALILAGLLGNLIDRVLLGGVTDMLDLGWWPVFNVADSALVIGVVGLIVYEMLSKRAIPVSGRAS